MAHKLVSCETCDNELVSDSLFCPRCLSYRREASEGWFPVDETGSDNPTTDHDLVPEHRVYPEKKVQELTREYNIDTTDLPKIQKSDPALDHLEVAEGDVIKLVRDSRTTDKAETYRLVISEDGRAGKRSTEAWRNPDDPAEEIFEVSEKVTEEQARHILSNTRAHVPPVNPGTCRRLAINRTDDIETAIERVRTGEPYTFIQGEFGTNGQFDGSRARYNGSFSVAEFEAAIEEYAAEFVVCSECGLPDTILTREDGVDMLRCEACGAFRPVQKQSGSSSSSQAPTLEEGKTYELEITGTGRKGDGVAEKGTYTIFVPGTQEGQVVTAYIENISGDLAFARLA